MTIKMNDLVNGYEALNNLATKELPISLSLKIMNNLKALSCPLEVYQEKHKEMVSKYAKRDEKGNIIGNESGNGMYIAEEKQTTFIEEFNKLMSCELEVSITKCNIADFEDMKISPKDLMYLSAFMIDGLESE